VGSGEKANRQDPPRTSLICTQLNNRNLHSTGGIGGARRKAMGDPDKADESLIPDHDEIRLTSPGWVAVEALDKLEPTLHLQPEVTAATVLLVQLRVQTLLGLAVAAAEQFLERGERVERVAEVLVVLLVLLEAEVA